MDQNDSGDITAADDRIVLGSPRPRWSGGLTNTVMFRSFDVNASIFARIGQMMDYEFAGNWKPDGIENGSRVNYWTPDNPTNDYPRPNSRFSNRNYQYFSTLSYADGSFVKLRDVTVGYTLPARLTEQLSIGRARLYVTGRDLFTWSRVGSYDPERGGAISFPMTRMIVAGFDIGF
jgi:TonB-dependent starch-binding outer membrane protein SusC